MKNTQPMNTLTRRGFLRQINCAAVGSGALLNTLINLRMANNLAAQGATGHKAMVALFLNGGVDSFNVLVPYDTTRYNTYSVSRGATGTEGGLALARTSLRVMTETLPTYGLHPSCVRMHEMATGTGTYGFSGKRRLAFLANVGTLVQPTTKSQFVAWENGSNLTHPVPRSLFSHVDQVEQWQTAVPQGLAQLRGWLGRAADVLNPVHNQSRVSMGISLNGNNVLQVGNQTEPFAITPLGSLAFTGDSGGSPVNPLQLKNSALRSTLDQHYANLLTESFSRITRNSDDAQVYFQGQFESPGAALPSNVNSLFSSGNPLAQTLRTVLRTIRVGPQMGLNRQTFFVNYGGWDHHGELLDTQAGMLTTLDQALGSFQQGLELLGLANNVVTFTVSDFGRTLRSNGRGSDHAWGGNPIVMGGPVDGGKLFGTYPNLALNSSDDVGRGGRFLPSTSADLYFAELLRWFGVPNNQLTYALPNLTNFFNPASTAAPLGFIKPA